MSNTKAHGLVRAVGIYTLSNIVVAAIPFLLLPVLTRVLTPADYGTVAMFGITVSAFGALTGLGTLGAIEVRYFELDRQDLAKYISGCIFILLVSTVVLAIFVWITSSVLSEVTAVPVNWLLACVSVSAMQFIILLRLTLWQVENQPKRYAIFQIGHTILNAIFSLVLVLLLYLTWRGRVWGICLSSLVICSMAFISLHRDGWILCSLQKEKIIDALAFGLPLVPHAIGGLAIVYIDRTLITNMLSVDQTGIYAVSIQIAMVVSLIAGSANKAISPWLFRQLHDLGTKKSIHVVRATYLYFFLLILLGLVVGLFAPHLFGIFVGDSFHSASTIVIYLALGNAFNGMYLAVTNYVFWAGATGRLSFITVLSGFLNLICSYYLIMIWGLEGAAFGYLLAQTMLFFGTWSLANHVYPLPWCMAIFRGKI